jgi:hypothetical protein
MLSDYYLIAFFVVLLFLGSGGRILSEKNTENMYTKQHDDTTQYLKEFLEHRISYFVNIRRYD